MPASSNAEKPSCKPGDERRIVAQSPVVTVEACSCGVVSLHFGPVTMRFTQESLEMLHRAVAQATIELARPKGVPEGQWATVSTRGVA